MRFSLININEWNRKEHYEHFLHETVCSYSAAVNLDITNLKGRNLYPAMLWLLTKAVNTMPEFRMALRSDGLGIYDSMHPAYTVFNPERNTFSVIWTEYSEDYDIFFNAYKNDTEKYAGSVHYTAKPGRPENSFDVSMIPWVNFTSFNLNIHNRENDYLLPIFTIGKYTDSSGKRSIPLAMQVHHAVCDGYHLGKFVDILQNETDRFKG